MQIRLDPDIARVIKKNADAHIRLFKRRKSHAAIVNEALRERFGKPFKAVDGVRDLMTNAKTVFGWADKP